jgi:hypothetical protein
MSSVPSEILNESIRLDVIRQNVLCSGLRTDWEVRIDMCSRRVVVACGQVALAGLWAGWSSHSHSIYRHRWQFLAEGVFFCCPPVASFHGR